jgi:hypothetical protein
VNKRSLESLPRVNSVRKILRTVPDCHGNANDRSPRRKPNRGLLEMTNRWGISFRVLRNARKYRIPYRIVRHVARRDKSCVYCKFRFRIGTRSRSNLASWEHMDGHSVKHPKVWNITLCCGRCNASRGEKWLADWFDSSYCKTKNISRQTVAPVVRRYLGRGLRG